MVNGRKLWVENITGICVACIEIILSEAVTTSDKIICQKLFLAGMSYCATFHSNLAAYIPLPDDLLQEKSMTSCCYGFVVQVLLSKVIFNFRRRAIPVTDERVKLMSEIVTAIKLVKMYAWEKSFAKKINGICLFE